MATKIIVVPEGAALSEADRDSILAELGGETIETLQGARATVARAQEKSQIKEKSEVGKAKDFPIEKIVTT